jgi:hypothetical protein
MDQNDGDQTKQLDAQRPRRKRMAVAGCQRWNPAHSALCRAGPHWIRQDRNDVDRHLRDQRVGFVAQALKED